MKKRSLKFNLKFDANDFIVALKEVTNKMIVFKKAIDTIEGRHYIIDKSL
ncbi:hypothetical protein LCGC14_2453170 [marine sediment metagenome]|uniref:Uncharacterized protein n=1 Tax=marine sediment metagenome TaxID=412755 RepID=A0A0F9E9D2_9ZZZZ